VLIPVVGYPLDTIRVLPQRLFGRANMFNEVEENDSIDRVISLFSFLTRDIGWLDRYLTRQIILMNSR
jgi:hypothetical protein